MIYQRKTFMKHAHQNPGMQCWGRRASTCNSKYTCIFVCLFCRKGVPLLYFVISALHFDFSADSCVAWFSKRVHFEDQWKLNSRKSWRLLGHYVISVPIVICKLYIVQCMCQGKARWSKEFKGTSWVYRRVILIYDTFYEINNIFL